MYKLEMDQRRKTHLLVVCFPAALRVKWCWAYLILCLKLYQLVHLRTAATYLYSNEHMNGSTRSELRSCEPTILFPTVNSREDNKRHVE